MHFFVFTPEIRSYRVSKRRLICQQHHDVAPTPVRPRPFMTNFIDFSVEHKGGDPYCILVSRGFSSGENAEKIKSRQSRDRKYVQGAQKHSYHRLEWFSSTCRP